MFLYDGETMRTELLDPILNRLQELYKIIERQDTFRFYSSSLLIMYGGIDNHPKPECSTSRGKSVQNSSEQDSDNSPCPNCTHSVDELTETGLVDVRMIDFAHSTHSGFQNDAPHKGIDQGYLFGLQNLITIFEDIQKRSAQPPNG